MEKLWRVQRLKDGTYGDWRLFEENKEGIIFAKGKIYKYKIKKEQMKILILKGIHGDNKGKKMQWRLKRTNLKVGDSVVLDCHDWKVIKVIEQKKEPKSKIIGIDYGVEGGDYTCWVSGYINKDGEIVIDRKGYKKVKKVKKVSRPYLETKVVKVKKEKDFWCGGMKIGDKQYKVFKRKNGVPYLKEFDKPQKGNWVNGENLDKIKFPCFCRYSKNRYGIITKTYIGEDKKTIYTIHGIENQYFSLSSIKSYSDLKKIIKAFDIHILKGKIILFEEE